jgi:hypothetical protein
MGRPSRLYQEEEVEVVLLPSEPEEEANSVVMEDAPVAEEGVEVEAPAVLLSKTGRQMGVGYKPAKGIFNRRYWRLEEMSL